MVNFTEEDPFDPKAVWLNAEHIRALPVEELAGRAAAGGARAPASTIEPDQMAQITPLIQERIRLLRDVLTVARFLLRRAAAALRHRRTDPARRAMRRWRCACSKRRREVLAAAEFTHDGLEAALRAAAGRAGHQGRPDVRAHPRGGVRAQDRAAAVRHAGSAGPRDLPASASGRPSES